MNRGNKPGRMDSVTSRTKPLSLADRKAIFEFDLQEALQEGTSNPPDGYGIEVAMVVWNIAEYWPDTPPPELIEHARDLADQYFATLAR
jgi:hypothetical protein